MKSKVVKLPGLINNLAFHQLKHHQLSVSTPNLSSLWTSTGAQIVPHPSSSAITCWNRRHWKRTEETIKGSMELKKGDGRHPEWYISRRILDVLVV
jgi:hypothetical protein